MDDQNVSTDRIMRISEVCYMTGLNQMAISRMEKSGLFPERVKIGERSVGWFVSDISRWMNAKKVGGNE